MKSVLIEITPSQAAALLAKNTPLNRKVRKTHVEALTGAIRRGEWRVTHQGIALAPDGSLLDGQHRLHAIIAAGIPVTMLVSFDVPADSFAVMDGESVPRSVSDRIHASKDSVAVARLALLAMGVVERGRVTADQIAGALEWLRAPLENVLRQAGHKSKVRTSAPVLLGVTARVLQNGAEKVLPAYRAFVLLDVPNIPSGPANFLRQIDSGRVSVRENGLAVAARAWVAFEPNDRNLSKLQLTSTERPLNELREVLEAARERHIADRMPAAA